MRKECKIEKAQGYVVIGREKLESFFTYSDKVRYRTITELRDGYHVTIPNEMGSSRVFVEHLSEAFALVGKYDNEAEAIERRAKDISNYLTSDKGAWGRGS